MSGGESSLPPKDPRDSRETPTPSESPRAAKSSERIARIRMRFASVRAVGRAFVRRYLADEAQLLFALTLVVGVVCGLVAVAFHLAIRGLEHVFIERALSTSGVAGAVWTIATPTLGGLFAGAALFWIVPGARGSGIPQVKQAFAMHGGRVRFRDALGKFIIGAIQIGSGASLGREGPTVQICAGATSLVARVASLPPRQIRRLTPVGVAAGIAAAFNAPIAAVTFTIEEIVGTLDHTVLSGVVVAAALAAVIERGILGTHPAIEVHESYGLDHASSLAFYAVLGIAAAAISILFTDALLKLRAWFQGMRVIPRWTQPAVGGLVTGILAFAMLRFFKTGGVNGGGYVTLGYALAGHLGVRILVAMCFVKLIATVFSYSSGGAGGIFAPTLFVGAMLGGAIGNLDVHFLHHEDAQLGAFALVGMGAVFAGVIRAPITSVLIIFEMTGGYGLVLPLMLANMTSYVIARHFRPMPIYDALLEQDGVVLPHASRRQHPLGALRVLDAMSPNVVGVPSDSSVKHAVTQLSSATFSIAPVIDRDGIVLGTVALNELRSLSPEDSRPITEVMSRAHLIGGDVQLPRAIERMNDVVGRQLVVVDAKSETRAIGMLAVQDLVRVYAERVRQTSVDPVARMDDATLRDVQANALAVEAELVDGRTKIAELFGSGVQRSGIVVVKRAQDSWGVVLAEQVRELLLDGEFARILNVDDVAFRAPVADPHTDLFTLVQRMSTSDAPAVVVLDAQSNQVVGIVTKSAVTAALLAWHSR